jgi:hypothetical protein
MKRAAYFLAAPLLCLIVFWRVPLTWFANDDFAWLGIPLEVHGFRSLLEVLFTPKAQGTVRVFSERLFFLTFASLFGLHAMPYHLFVLATWIGDLTLATLIGARLTGSRAAGLLAAIFWTTCGVVVIPLEWASAYNEVLCAFCILLAFYARLRWIDSGERRWRIVEWAAYLAGFGVLEIIVVYPVLAAWHALCTDRKRLRSTYLMFVPAVAFGIAHLLLIPKNAGPYYALSIDARLPRTFFEYLIWTLGPTRLGGRRNAILAALVGIALLIFVIAKVRRGKSLALFFCGWFVLLLGPVLPLPNHVEDYYATLPALGLAWLAGWAMVEAWQSTRALRILAVFLGAAYLFGSVQLVENYSRWSYDRSLRMRLVVMGVESVAQRHPDATILLEGVDNDLFQSGFQDNPWRLFGLQKLYLVPGSEQGIVAREDLGGIAPFLIAPRQALDRIEHRKAYVLAVASDGTHDVTRSYEAVLRADPRATRRDSIDVGDPNDAAFLGPEWHPAENGFRWMPRVATLKMAGPLSAAERLYVSGYTPTPVVANGPVTLSFRVDGMVVGSATLTQPDQQFSFNFALPAELTGRATLEIGIEASKALHPDGDHRELAMVFGTFAIR